jgi:hypothetical protein
MSLSKRVRRNFFPTLPTANHRWVPDACYRIPRMRRGIWWFGLLAAISGLIGAGAARAEIAPSLAPSASEGGAANDAKARAQEHLDRGNQLLDARAFDGALAEFRAAYGAFSSPKILYNQAEAECELGRFVDAAAHYDAFLRGFAQPETDEDARRIEAARQAARAARAKIATIDPNAAGAVEVLVDARSFGKTPLAQPIAIDPGRHRISFRRAGAVESSREVVLSPGQRLRLDPDPITLLAEPAPPPKSLLRRWPFWAVTGAVILGGVVATYAATRSSWPTCPTGTVVGDSTVSGCTSGRD